QAEQQYHTFETNLKAALAGSNLPGQERFGVYGLEAQLRDLMGLSPSDGRLIRPIEEPTQARVEFDWDEAMAQMLYLSPELRRAQINIKQRELETISAKNQVLPEVNLSLLYRWVGVGDEFGAFNNANGIPPVQTGSQALEVFADGDFQEAAVTLDITPSPIGSRRELARVRGAQLQKVRQVAFYREAQRLLVGDLGDAIRKTYSHYGQLQSLAQAWQSSEAEVDARLKSYLGGREQINVVLQSQQRRATAQADYYRALAEYNKSINFVDYLRGTLLANSNITLSEGPWNDKAYWDALERARERSAGRKKVYGVTRPSVVRQGPVMSKPGDMHSIGEALDFGTPRTPVMPPSDQYLQQMGSTPGDLIQQAPITAPSDLEPSLAEPLPTEGPSDVLDPVPRSVLDR
ncbi:MAG: TolC family protein, partial [Planctomycetota bacterium]